MVDNIVTEERTTFKMLEENVFKIACEIANTIMRNLLEEYDKELIKTRDKAKYRHKGYETTTLKTMTGLVEYRRAKYLQTKEDGTKKCTYLTDEMLQINKVGQFSSGIIDLMIKNIKEVSYRACSQVINNCTGANITGVSIWNIIQKLGDRIKENENLKVQAYEEDKLEAGKKESPVVYQEADGVCIYTQGKLRKEQIKKYKKEHPNEEVPKRVRNIELKLGMTYEGWKKTGTNRFELVGKEYVSGYMTGEEMAEITKANLHSKYAMSKVELRVLNSDGASWIKQLLVKGTIYQADSYHIKEKISKHVRDIRDVEVLKEMFWKKEYTEMIQYVQTLKYKYDGEYEEVVKLEELKRYLEKRQDSMARYNDNPEIKKRLKDFSKKTGLKYRNMGCQESNNYSILTRRFKHRRMSWSKSGSENLAKVITTYSSQSCTDIMSNLELQILPQEFIEYAEKHIRKIEENIKRKKINSKHIGYEMKQGTLSISSNIRNILKSLPMSELTYR